MWLESSLGRGIAVVALAAIGCSAALVACSDSDDGEASAGLGEACSHEGDEACSGDYVLQCNLVDGALEWSVKKDCRDTGRTCSQVSSADADCQG